jgi:hypothetical protein
MRRRLHRKDRVNLMTRSRRVAAALVVVVAGLAAVRVATRDDPQVSVATQTLGAPAFVKDGAAVYDLRLIDGERFRLSIPEALAGDLTLTQQPGPSPIAIDGASASIAITFGCCPNQDAMTENHLGSAVARSGGLINVCRPDELLVMVVTAKVNPADVDLDRFDLRPIAMGFSRPVDR